MTDRKVVGWFYRNGKRIPIFEKVTATQRRVLSSAEHKTAVRNSDNPNLAAAAIMGMHPEVDAKIMMSKDGIYRAGQYEDYNRAKELGWEYEGTVSDAARKSGVFDDKPRNRGMRRDPNPKQLRENVKARDRKSRNEVLEYDHDAAKAFEGIFDVESPRKVANSMGKRVRTSDGKIVRPVKRSGMDLETRVNNDIGRNPEAYGITPESKVNDAVAESVGKELASKLKRGGPRKIKKDPNALDRDVPKYLKSATGSQTPGYEGAETAFTDSRGERQWAKNVDSLPEKKNKFSNGYGKLGSTETRDIYADRDSTNGDYYAVPKKPGGTGGVGGRSPRPGIRYSAGKNKGEAALRKNALDPRGKRGNGIRLPQEKALADKKPGESYIKYIMEERGLSRADAVKFIMDKRKKG